MSDLEIPRCAWCNRPIKNRGRRGPMPTYCSSAHRKAASRARRAAAPIVAELAPSTRPKAKPPKAPAVDEQVARAILEAQGLAGTFARLGIEARPQLAWRCERIANALAHALEETIGEW